MSHIESVFQYKTFLTFWNSPSLRHRWQKVSCLELLQYEIERLNSEIGITSETVDFCNVESTKKLNKPENNPNARDGQYLSVANAVIVSDKLSSRPEHEAYGNQT